MKYLSIIRYALLTISAAIILIWIFILDESQVDTMLYWTYGLLFAAIALIIIMPMINMIKNPKGAIRSFVGLGIIAVLGIIAYSLGSAEPVQQADGTFFTDPLTLKLSDAGIYLTYVAMVITIVAAVYGEIRNAFK